jgi:hypothetical protein
MGRTAVYHSKFVSQPPLIDITTTGSLSLSTKINSLFSSRLPYLYSLKPIPKTETTTSSKKKKKKKVDWQEFCDNDMEI